MENRQFTVDPSILFSIINAQAGTLPKALLEAVMNAIDAGATKCVITLDTDKFTVKDDGRGFQSRTEIEDWFERFGTPHKEGDAVYGRFRMGRGQMMAFAKTQWRTGEFAMDVDIKANGLAYGLKQGLKSAKGCAIEGSLYKPLQVWELQTALKEVADLVRFAQVPVHLNSKVVSRVPGDLKWDLDTAEAWVKVDSSSDLKVYNLGVLVRSYPAYQFGTGGVVVTKIPVQVNFARNDILTSQCQVWPRIVKSVKAMTGEKAARKTSLTDSEREFLAQRIRSGELDLYAAPKARVVTTAVGSQVALETLAGATLLTLSPGRGDRLAERLHRSRVAFVLSQDTLDRFRVETVEEFLDVVRQALPSYYSAKLPAAVSFSEVAQGYSKLYELVDPMEFKPEERLALQLLSRQNLRLGEWLSRAMAELDESRHQLAQPRKLLIGSSDAALAWTDGKSTITLDRRFLRKEARSGLNGWFRILSVLVHEYCHLGMPDLDGHSHPQEFFELYEALMTFPGCPIAELAAAAALRYAEDSVKEGNKLSRAALRSVSRSLIPGDAPETTLASKPAPVPVPGIAAQAASLQRSFEF